MSSPYHFGKTGISSGIKTETRLDGYMRFGVSAQPCARVKDDLPRQELNLPEELESRIKELQHKLDEMHHLHFRKASECEGLKQEKRTGWIQRTFPGIFKRAADETEKQERARKLRELEKMVELLQGFMGVTDEYVILIDCVALKPGMAGAVMALHHDYAQLEEELNKETLTRDALLSFLEKVNQAYIEIMEGGKKSGDGQK